MAWRTNAAPQPTITELNQRIVELERRLAALEKAQRPVPALGGGWNMTRLEPLGDLVHAPWAKGDVAAPAVPGGETRAERRGPARPADFMSDVIVPLCWTCVTGLVVGGAFAVVIDPLGGDWWLWFKIGGGLGVACMWAYRMIDHSRLLWAVETVTHKDIDGDKQVGKPVPPEPQRIEYELSQVDGKGRLTGMKRLDLIGIDPDVLREFAAAAVQGESLTVARWTGASGQFSQPQYTAMMAELERAGLVEPGHGNQPRSLTLAGRAVLRRIAA